MAVSTLRLARQVLLLSTVTSGCGGSGVPLHVPLLQPTSRPAPFARVETLPSIDRDTVCQGQLVIEIDRLVIRKYPRPADTPPFHYLPIVVAVLTVPGGPDEGDVTVVAGHQDYRPGDRVRIVEGRLVLNRPVRRLRGLNLEVHLAENHTTLTPTWETYAGVAGQAAQALPGPTSGVITTGAEIFRRLDHDDVMLTWQPPIDDLVSAARQARQLHYRLLTPATLPDGQPAAELDLLVRVDDDATCH